MSLRPAILRIGRRSLSYSKSLVLRQNARSYIVGNRIESTFKHPNPKRDSNSPPPRSDSVEDEWLLSIKRRIAKCLTYGTTPKEQEAAAQILKQLNAERIWRTYLDRFPSTKLAFGLHRFRPSVDEFDPKAPEPNDQFSVLHRISSCYPYELKIGSILISEKHRFTVAKSQHHYYWKDDLNAPSTTNPYAQGTPGKLPEYVVSILDKYFLHQLPYVQTPYGRPEIEEAVAVLEECYQRPEDMGSASKPAAPA
ncbi:hypothetical protein TWF718_004656 [Orbilia javanica]|uniref:Uncharacterized protein n=1 Tax=Orbilia javanica TaxID=47235 RepID=A0AAN8N6K6_9PEZI